MSKIVGVAAVAILYRSQPFSVYFIWEIILKGAGIVKMVSARWTLSSYKPNMTHVSYSHVKVELPCMIGAESSKQKCWNQ